MARTSLSARTLGLAAATLIGFGVAGGATAWAQPVDPQAPVAPGNQVVPTDPSAPPLAQPPYYQPAPGDQQQPYPQQPQQPQQPYQGQPYPQQPYPGDPQQPQQPYYGGQQPYYNQPYYGQPAPVYTAPQYAPRRRTTGYTDRFRPQFGIGLHVTGLYSGSELSGFGSEGIGADLLFRVHPRWTIEMSIQYQSVSSIDSYGYYNNNSPYYDRFDVPILGGARLHLGNPFWVFSPYLVGAAGATYSKVVYDPAFLPESHWFFEAQAGVGAEIRLGSHFLLNADIRGFGRFRGETPNDMYVQTYNGDAPVLGNSGGILFNFGFAGLF